MTFEFQLADDVAASLEAAGLKVQKNVTIGGVKPDLLVSSSDGRAFVVDVKQWTHPGKVLLDRAAHQVDLYEKVLGADKAFVVVPGLDCSLPDQGLFKIEDLAKAIFLELDYGAVLRAGNAVVVPASKLIFAAVPFAPEYEDTFFLAMAYAAQQVGAACKRVDQEPFAGNIVEEIKLLIQASSAVIADLSEAKPNVLYEVGYAHGLGRPTVHVCSTPMNQLPFDVAQWRTLRYVRGQIHALRVPLVESLRAAVSPGPSSSLLP